MIFKSVLCLILIDFPNLKVPQLLIGATTCIWFSQSEAMLLSNFEKESVESNKECFEDWFLKTDPDSKD